MAITGIDTIEGKQIIAAGAVSAKSAEMAYNDENGNPITGYQVAGDYLTTADSANFYTTANESGFITGVDLTPYQLTADMTAYQPVGDYLTTADSANFYTTANESGFITGVPAGTMNESAFGYDASDNITAYNGSAFAGGSDVPEGVMVESGLEYNAVNEISGYNGSAIAQYGAEKQWLVHDDTLVHVSNSAQYALGVNLSAVAQLLGVDETVLWSGDATHGDTISLSEPYSAFQYLGIEVYDNYGWGYNKAICPTDKISIAGTRVKRFGASYNFVDTNNNDFYSRICNIVFQNNEFISASLYTRNLRITTAGSAYNQANTNTYVSKIIGIGRKQ